MNQVTTISNERMKAFVDTIVMQTREALVEREQDILRVWHENIEEAHENEKKFPPLKIGISATVDLENARIETVVSFTAKYSTTISTELPDPNQPELPAFAKNLKEGESVEIITPSGKGVKIEHGGKVTKIAKK